MSRTQAERSAATREALTEGAVRALIAHGYAGTTVRVISAESGVSAGALQHHFPSKEALMIAALVHIFEEVARRLEDVRQAGEPAERAKRIVATLWEFYGGERYLAAAEIVTATRKDAAMHEPVRESRVALGDAYNRMWDRLMADTPLSPRGRRTLLRFVIATMRGLSLLKVHEPEPELYAPELAWLADLIALAMRAGDGFLAEGRAAGRRPVPQADRLALI